MPLPLEHGYALLKKKFPAAGTSYALARVLMLGQGGMAHHCERVIAALQAEGFTVKRAGG